MAESDNPKHYKDKSIETWDAILSQVSEEEAIGYLRCSSMKHLMRFGSKGGLTIDKAIMDVMKSIRYSQKLLDVLNIIKKEGGIFKDFDTANVENLFKGKDNDKKKRWTIHLFK